MTALILAALSTYPPTLLLLTTIGVDRSHPRLAKWVFVLSPLAAPFLLVGCVVLIGAWMGDEWRREREAKRKAKPGRDL